MAVTGAESQRWCRPKRVRGLTSTLRFVQPNAVESDRVVLLLGNLSAVSPRRFGKHESVLVRVHDCHHANGPTVQISDTRTETIRRR
jgi:hypothetical protein